MAETIYTVPITGAYEQDELCPFCALRRRLEAETIAYISGPAMMEPSVRRETNRLGFCRDHYGRLLETNNRLGLALLLESHLTEVSGTLRPEKRGLFGGKPPDTAERARALAGSCFVCDRVAAQEERVLSNAAHMWKTDTAFRERFTRRRDYCLPHGAGLLSAGRAELGGGDYQAYQAGLAEALTGQIEALKTAVGGFAAGYDYRNTGKPLSETEKTAVEAAIAFLTGRWT